MLVSVIIPSYNRRHELSQCIDSVLTQRSVSIEIIVVDDCSQDDTRVFLTLNYPHVRFIHSKRRVGPSHLRNLGLRAAEGEFVLFLDSDVVLPSKRVIQETVRIMSENPCIGELGGEIPVYQNITDKAFGKRRDFFGRNHDVISKKVIGGNQPKDCTYLATCNCMVRKSIAFEVGGFDPYFEFGGEDADFGFRVLMKGYSNQVCIETGVHHYRSFSGRYLDETLRYHRTRIRFNLKHFAILRNFVIGTADFIKAVLFYLLLVPKIVFKKTRHIPLVPENYLGGWYLIKAYLQNFKVYEDLKRQRNANFLTDEEIEKFERQPNAFCQNRSRRC